MFVVVESNGNVIDKFDTYADAADFADRYRHINDSALVQIKEVRDDII